MTCIGVAVAGLWSGVDAPRAVDAPALDAPVRLESWLTGLDDETRLALCREKRLGSQALLDTPVTVVARHTDRHGTDWCQVVVPSQPSRLDARGYPGWLPAAQLADAPGCRADDDAVLITAPTAWLQGLPQQPALKLSFLTRLRPAAKSDGGDGDGLSAAGSGNAQRVWVDTALGRGWLARDSVHLPGERFSADATTLETLGRRFDGLRYLWAGNSSFGYDCSGLVHSLFAAVGIRLPRDAGDQVETGTPIALDERRPGDLLFFEKPDAQGRVSVDHVALYLGDDRMLHSPTNNARVECRRLIGSRYEEELCAVRRFL